LSGSSHRRCHEGRLGEMLQIILALPSGRTERLSKPL
jgi:hypothetical protein